MREKRISYIMQYMKTLVEIYDNEQPLNILTSFNKKPEKVIFLYDKSQEEMIHNAIVEKYIDAEVEYILNKDIDIDNLLKEVEDVAIDVHGGNDLLIAKISQYGKDNHCELYYPDIYERKMVVMKDDTSIAEDLKIPKLKVNDVIELYGGSIRNLPEIEYDDRGREAVNACMEIKRKNNKRWVSFCKLLSGLSKKYMNAKDWYVDNNTYQQYRGIFEELNCIFNISDEKGKKKIGFKDDNYRILVTDTGVPFEYDTYYQLKDSEYFDDVDIRVNIDWNGAEFNKEDPNSELDVVATKDSRLISISCKAGKYDQQAIYEVKANAEKFGGKLAIPVLCTDLNIRHPELVKKANEIDVLLVEYKQMWDKEFVRELQKWMETH